MGPPGYRDDVYILCLCFNDLLSDSKLKIKALGVNPNFIFNILSNDNKMLDKNIIEQIKTVYNSY